MGRTNPTYRDALRELEGEWQPFRRALRARYVEDFDRLFERARRFAGPAGYANPRDPERAALWSVLLAQEVALRELSERVDELAADGVADPAPGARDGDPLERATDDPGG